MSHISISHASKDIDFADKIVQSLNENDSDTWIEWKSIPLEENRHECYNVNTLYDLLCLNCKF